jgi:hypothetical protein
VSFFNDTYPITKSLIGAFKKCADIDLEKSRNVITRNIKDFKNADIIVITPEDFLGRFE